MTRSVRRPGSRLVGPLVVISILLVIPAARATDYQDGYSATANGLASSAGPLRNETAFEIELPGSIAWASMPIIRDGKVYVLVSSVVSGGTDHGEYTLPGKTARGIFEIDLATGKNRTVVPMDVDGYSMAADDDKFYVITRAGLQAYGFRDGQPKWAQPWNGTSNIQSLNNQCAAPVLRGDAAYIVCMARIGTVGQNCPGKYVAKIGRADGKARWIYWNHSLDVFGLPTLVDSCGINYHRLSVIGDYVYLTTAGWSTRKGTEVNAFTDVVFQLRESSGEFVTFYNATHVQRKAGYADEVNPADPDPDSVDHSQYWEYPPVTGRTDRLLLRIGDLRFVDPESGKETYRSEVERNNWGREDGAGMAFDGRRLFFTVGREIHAVDVDKGGEPIWPPRAALLQPHEYWESDHVTLSRGVLYAHSNLHIHEVTQVQSLAGTEAVNTHTFWAIDADTGQPVWSRRLDPSALPNNHADAKKLNNGEPMHGSTWTPEHRFTIGEGVFVAGSITGKVLVIGRTAASIAPVFGPMGLYPALGEIVTVDLSASKPGIFGPATEFKATWGDGTASDWQASSIFSHAYDEAGQHDATFELRNQANQTSIEKVQLCVACQDPALAEQLARLQDENGAAPLSTRESDGWEGKTADLWRILAAIAGATFVLLLIPLATRRRQMLTMPRFRIESELGYGATSKVLLAHDTVLDRKVVLKQPLSPWLLESHGREKFLREAQILAKLNHPNVVGIHEVLAHEEPPMLVLEFVPKGSLKDRLRGEPKLQPRDAVRITLDVLSGLGHVHDHGIIHRDIKPGNILLTDDGSAKLTDFNIAQPPPDVAKTITTSALSRHAGSPSYMSPEQTLGSRLDPRSDLYSVGAVLYEMLTGAHYLGDAPSSERELAERIRGAPVALPHPDVPLRMAVFLEKVLAKDPSHRFPNADAMRRGLLDVVRRTKAPLGSR